MSAKDLQKRFKTHVFALGPWVGLPQFLGILVLPRDGGLMPSGQEAHTCKRLQHSLVQRQACRAVARASHTTRRQVRSRERASACWPRVVNFSLPRSVVLELRASGRLVSLTPVPLPARAALRQLAVSRTHCVALTQGKPLAVSTPRSIDSQCYTWGVLSELAAADGAPVSEQVVFTWDVVDWRGVAHKGEFNAGLESWRKPQHQPQCLDSLTGLGITRSHGHTAGSACVLV